MRKLTDNKKGDVTITTIIVAALGLLVLVVLIMVFTGRLGTFTTGVTDVQAGVASCQNQCSALGQEMSGLTLKDRECPGGETTLRAGFPENKVCCCKAKTTP